jgi:hypothetical protein
VVQLEQVGQLVRVLLAGLQLVDQLELALDQALRPAGQVDEHVVDVAAQTGLLGRQLDGPLVQLVEGLGDVADLVPGVDPDGFDFVRCRRCVRSLQPGDRLRQPDLGDVTGAGLQPPQRADHRPGDEQRGQERDDEDRAMITPVVIACRCASERRSLVVLTTWSCRPLSTPRIACM